MLGIPFEVRSADVEERRGSNERPEAYVERLALEKAQAVQEAGHWVVAGDTVVVLDGDVLEKPTTPSEAERMLLRLAGRSHEVLSGLALADPQGTPVSLVARASVWCRPFDAQTARLYVRTGEPMDKAGAYGIQSRGAALIERVEGDFFTVMGMSVAGLMTLFERAGLDYRFGIAHA